MKHFTLMLGILLLFSAEFRKLSGQTTLYIKEKTGAQTAIALSETRKIDFSGSLITVTKTNAVTQPYALNDIRFLSFKNYFLGIPDPGSEQKDVLSLYPNPVNNILHVEYTGKQSKEWTFEFLDLQGRVIQTGNFQDRKARMDVSKLNAGMYICRNHSNSEVIVRKFIKN
jgi:hypothetical protein